MKKYIYGVKNDKAGVFMNIFTSAYTKEDYLEQMKIDLLRIPKEEAILYDGCSLYYFGAFETKGGIWELEDKEYLIDFNQLLPKEQKEENAK